MKLNPLETTYVVAAIRATLDNQLDWTERDREILRYIMLRLAGSLDLPDNIKRLLDEEGGGA